MKKAHKYTMYNINIYINDESEIILYKTSVKVSVVMGQKTNSTQIQYVEHF
jgi:hypothetical protein